MRDLNTKFSLFSPVGSRNALRRLNLIGLLLGAFFIFGFSSMISGGCSAPESSRCAEEVCKVTLNRSCTANEDCCCSQACVQGRCVPSGGENVTGEVSTEKVSVDGQPEGTAGTEETVADGSAEPTSEPMIETPTPDGTVQEPTTEPSPETPPQEQSPETPLVCTDGQSQPCYEGPAGTADKGECKSGSQICSNNAWGPCQGQVQPVIEACDGKDNDCDGQVDEGCKCQNGETQDCYTGSTGCTQQGASFQCTSPCQKGSQVCKGAQWDACTGEVLPQKELCDNKDNDCDGKTDEDFPTKGASCTSGQAPCESKGQFVCKQDGSGVECNAGPPTGTAEVCDNKDNDCDGKIDETFAGKGSPCTAGTGECRENGIRICNLDGTGLTCNATPKAAQIEECNGRDDDCDGKTDENIAQVCSSNFRDVNDGICRAGLRLCSNGQWGQCQGEVRAMSSEQCTSGSGPAVDENCNGDIDEGCNCQRNAQRSCGSNVGECRTGTQTCGGPSSARWGSCQNEVGPATELCDGKDNDCDGKTDEHWPSLGNSCTAGRGECLATGKIVCRRDGSGVACDAQAGAPVNEICGDGKDNDCNGKIDDGCP
ncbi:MAG: hypothetical protein H6727_05550 [Myxococcales bacterium]|nr:hypothetical protein [Myxococcales bacterium]